MSDTERSLTGILKQRLTTASGGERSPRNGERRPQYAHCGLDLIDLMDALKNQRRRWVVRHLDELDTSSGIGIATVAEWVATVENDYDGPRALDAQERKRVYVGLYQCHIPKLERYGVVICSGDNRLRQGPNFEQAAGLLADADAWADEGRGRDAQAVGGDGDGE